MGMPYRVCPCGNKHCSINPSKGVEMSAGNRKAARRYRKTLARATKRAMKRTAIQDQLLSWE